MARPAAFGIVIIYVVFWAIFDRESFNFHGAVALITLCMNVRQITKKSSVTAQGVVFTRRYNRPA
jgi:hypothetical protein